MGNVNAACLEGLLHHHGGKQPAPGGFKVCVCGGAGSVGQHLALLMAMEPLVTELSVFDVDSSQTPAGAVAEDLRHLGHRCAVQAYSLGIDKRPVRDLPPECLTGCSLVLVLAGLPRRAGQAKRELAHINANIAKLLVEACAKFCPQALVALMVSPICAVVPAMAALYEKRKLDPSKILGVTSLGELRAGKFVHEVTGVPIEEIHVPVVGGHGGRSIVPLFSQDVAAARLTVETRKVLDLRVQEGDGQVIKAKQGKGSATLTAGYAGARLAKAVLQGLAGWRTAESAFVRSEATELPYFASRVTFGRRGVERVHPLPRNLDAYEQERLEEAKGLLREEIEAGLAYAKINQLLRL